MPANTGNIGRTCVATGVRLHLIEPLGFLLNDKMVKRAGLDYWDRLDVTRYDDYNDFLAKNPGAKVYMATTKSKQKYTDVKYEDDCFIMFGAESIPAGAVPSRSDSRPCAGQGTGDVQGLRDHGARRLRGNGCPAGRAAAKIRAWSGGRREPARLPAQGRRARLPRAGRRP